ncbi:MAG: hypothetical protein J6570_00700 [Snodgrassella sp.]|jgi:hypothetical protein|nr:hypothetical protein [Snodgrassella sp.]
MKEFYYIYNNEALACCVFIAALHHCQTMDIARICLILPFVFDERTVNYFTRKQRETFTLQQLIDEKQKIFLSFSSRYNMLLPVCINALHILSKNNVIELDIKVTKKKGITFEDEDLGKRFNKINRMIPKLVQMMNFYSTDELYRILKIKL